MKTKKHASAAKTGRLVMKIKASDMKMRQGMSMPDSFSDMLHNFLLLQPRLLRTFKLPPWLLFPATYNRQDQASLTAMEQGRFLCAFDVINANGTLGKLVDIHGDMTHQMHGTLRFLPWHRIFLLTFEQALRSIHPDVSIPYWNWTQPAEQNFPTWLSTVLPTVVTPTKTVTVSRFPQSSASLAAITSNTPAIMSDTDFPNFTFQLEGIVHNAVHTWVGGSMGSIPTAPADPIFWMHHCNIDRLWWQWQTSAQGTGKNPPLTGAAAVLDPWSYVESDTRDITALGYSYV
jgi:tyrosinase